jgi:hypothetical protein
VGVASGVAAGDGRWDDGDVGAAGGGCGWRGGGRHTGRLESSRVLAA